MVSILKWLPFTAITTSGVVFVSTFLLIIPMPVKWGTIKTEIDYKVVLICEKIVIFNLSLLKPKKVFGIQQAHSLLDVLWFLAPILFMKKTDYLY